MTRTKNTGSYSKEHSIQGLKMFCKLLHLVGPLLVLLLNAIDYTTQSYLIRYYVLLNQNVQLATLNSVSNSISKLVISVRDMCFLFFGWRV